jgi:uncharacterized protein with FMN-binding domain
MRIKEKHLGLILVIFIFGGIFLSSSMEVWKTESSKEPVKITSGYEAEEEKNGIIEEMQESEEEKSGIIEEVQEAVEVIAITETPDFMYNDGVYIGISRGYKSNIEVSVEIMSDRIVSVNVLSHHESRGYYEEAVAVIPSVIVDNQSPNVDAISGATYTSRAIIEATKEAMNKALK